MVIFDTETTNLTVPEAAPIDQQPYIIEFAAIKVNIQTLVEESRLEFFVRPPRSIPEDSTKITGITNAMVQDALPFAGHYRKLCNFFGGQRWMAAHNLSFDILMLKYELMRIGKLTAFPWPPNQVCTVEASLPLHGYRMGLGDLHRELTGEEHQDAHRAMADVEALLRVVRVLRKKKMM